MKQIVQNVNEELKQKIKEEKIIAYRLFTNYDFVNANIVEEPTMAISLCSQHDELSKTTIWCILRNDLELQGSNNS